MLPNDLLTPKQAARLLSAHVSTIHRWIAGGKIKAYRRGTSRYLIRRADAEAMLREVVPAAAVATRSEEQKRAEASLERLAKLGIGGKVHPAAQECPRQ